MRQVHHRLRGKASRSGFCSRIESVSVANVERCGVRDSYTVNVFREALRSVTGHGHARVLAQYCGCCHTRHMGVGAPHTTLMVIPSRYGNRAQEFAQWVSRRTPSVLVDGIAYDGVSRGEVFYRQVADSSPTLRCSVEGFADMCLSQHRITHRLVSNGGLCHHGAGDGDVCRICGEPDGFHKGRDVFVNLDPQRPDLWLSSTLRVLPAPMRHIDTDILLVDADGAPRLVVEMSDDPRRSANYLKSLSALWGVPVVHALTSPVRAGTPLREIPSKTTIIRHGRPVLSGTLSDAVSWCEDRI